MASQEKNPSAEPMETNENAAIAMLSAVLRRQVVVDVSVQIMKSFVEMHIEDDESAHAILARLEK